MTSSVSTWWKIIFVAAVVFSLGATAARAEGYKGAISSDTLVFDVTYQSGDAVVVETWFAQWVGNVYSKAVQSEVPRDGPISSKRGFCESASWIAPERHIWKEGDPPYLTKSHKMKLRRLEHSMRRVRCRKNIEETRGVSKRALKNAVKWIGSRELDTYALARDKAEIGSVETWILANVPGAISTKLNTRKLPQKSPLSVAQVSD